MNCYTIFLLAVLTLANEENDIDVDASLKEAGIIPDVIDSPPEEILEANFGHRSVQMGNELKPTQVKNPPFVKWNADPKALYVLIMTDPDAPSRKTPKLREFLHWMVGNIPEGNVKQGETLMEYIGSAPPKGSGLHRYVLIVYRQPGKISFKEPFMKHTTRSYRSKFSTRDFAEKYNLKGPEAVNFFQAGYDSYVPVIQSLL